MSGSRRQSAAGVRPEMNVTRPVDVVLVLRTIFMVVAPRLEQDVQVDLPGVFNSDSEVIAVDPLKVTVAKAGEYYIDERPFGLDDAIERSSGPPLRAGKKRCR